MNRRQVGVTLIEMIVMNRRQAGFTLVEMMTVVVLMGILAGFATTVSPSGGDARGLASQVAADLESARMRSLARRRWHRVTLQSGRITIDQATTTGMASPTSYQEVSATITPRNARIVAMATSTLLVAGSPPVEGAGLSEVILFSPDGSSQARTIWVNNRKDLSPQRIALFAATGHARIYAGW
jgi:prepilin-type N-terminal cleavage/methylation domain-containing protein